MNTVKFHKVDPAIGKDGVDFINMTVSSVTTLGRFLSMRARVPFTHPVYGDFMSVEALWVYLTNEVTPENEQDIRVIRNKKNLTIGRSLTRKQYDDAMVKSIIGDITEKKIINNKEMHDLLISNELPFKLFYVSNSDEKVYPDIAKWYIKLIYDIRDRCIAGHTEATFPVVV